MNKLLICTVLLLATLADNIYCRKHRQTTPPPQELMRALEINATEIQEHVDKFFFLASLWLRQPSNQNQIIHYLQKAANITSMINARRIRRVANEIVDEALSAVERINNRTINTLYQVASFIPSYSLLENNPKSRFNVDLHESEIVYGIYVGKSFLELRQFIAEEIKNLKEMVSCKLSQFIFMEITRIEERDLNNLEDVHYLLTKGLEFFDDHFGAFLSKLESGSVAFDVLKHMIFNRTNQNLESRIRSLALSIADKLSGLNVRSLRGTARDVINLVVRNFEELRSELVQIVRNTTSQYYFLFLEENFRASLNNNTMANGTNYENYPPLAGIVISDRLENIRENLGEEIVNYRDNTIREIKNFARDVLQSLTIRNIPSINEPDFHQVSKEVFVEIMGDVSEFFKSLGTAYNIYRFSSESRWPDPPTLWSI